VPLLAAVRTDHPNVRGAARRYRAPGDRVFDLAAVRASWRSPRSLGAASALGADIDPEAERMTRETPAGRRGRSASFRLGSVRRRRRRFELVTANILADVLVDLLKGLTGASPRWRLILSASGRSARPILPRRLAGFGVVEPRREGGWPCWRDR
jgi:ribosomal protein L11 methylase PrmA